MSEEKKETIKKEEVKKVEPKKEMASKIEPKKTEEIKKDFEKVEATKVKKAQKPSTGRGLSMKNWIFIVIAIVIAFGAGYYIAFVGGQNQVKSCQNTINEYENSVNTLQQKQDIIQDLLSK